LPRRLLLAPFTARDTTGTLLSQAISLLSAGRAEHDYSGILYLTPSPRKLRDTQLRFAAVTDEPAVVPPRFATIGQLARELHHEHSERVLLRSELRPLLVRRLLAATSAGTSLGYARAVSDFIADVKRYIPETERAGLRKRLGRLLAAFEKPLARVNQALDGMERYQSLIEERGWVDEHDLLDRAADLAREYVDCRVLVLDGFVSPDQLEQRVLKALVSRADSVLALAWSPAEEYDYAARFPAFLRAIGAFEAERLKAEPVPEQELRAFNGIDDEVRGICRDIKRRFLGRELNLGRTVVCFPNLSRYAPALERMLESYGIPFTLYPSRSLATSPPLVAVLELLTALETEYERLAFAAVLSSPFFPHLLHLPSDKGTAGAVRAARRVNVDSRRAGVIKGRADWRRIGSRLIAALELEGKERDEARDIGRRVRHALGVCDKLLWDDSRRPWQSLGEYARALKQFLEAARFRSEPEFDPEEKDELRSDRRQLYDILDDIVELESTAGAMPASGSDFVRTLSYLVRQHSRDTSSRRPHGVTVVSMTETLGLNPGHLYLGGLAEPDLPAPYPPDSILPDWVRKDLGMPDIDLHRDWQRFHFDRTRVCCREAPFLSFHNSDADSPVLPTPFLDLEPRSGQTSDIIYSQEEHQQLEGEQLRTRLEDTTPPVDFSTDREVLKALSATYGPSHSISVTRLESYRRCPFLFYLERVLGIESMPEPAYEIDNREWGLLVHRVLAEVYAQGPVPLEQIPDLANQALERALPDSGLPEFWQQVSRRVIQDFLPAFVDREQEMREQGFLPARVEAEVEGEPAADIKVHGRVDRIDEGKNSFRVIDYKTGSTASISGPAVTKTRTHIQLPLYALLLQAGYPGQDIDNLGVWSVREARVKWLAGRNYPVPDLVGAALETARDTVLAIRSGRFPVEDTNPQVCRNCDLAFLCGRHETGRDND
jgi:ATP-dependent helicase/DNAse subunit B